MAEGLLGFGLFAWAVAAKKIQGNPALAPYIAVTFGV